MLDDRLLPDRIDGELDPVPGAARTHIEDALVAIQDERHGNDGLERIALSAAVGGDIGLPARDAHGEVQDIGDRLRRDAGAVVGDGDPGGVDPDGDLGPDLGLLAGVEGVVDQLLQHDQRPCVGLVPGLRDQLLPATEVQEPAGAERGALQFRCCCPHRSTPWSGGCQKSDPPAALRDSGSSSA